MMLPLALSLVLACGDKDADTAPDVDQDGFSAEVDCDDRDPDVNPGALEICDGVDNNCDALVDDDDPEVDVRSGTIYYLDADFDGWGDPAQAVTACLAPAGYTSDDSDCDDGDSDVNPDAAEVCDEVDNDCNELVDDGADGQTWYPDADGDGYGDDFGAVVACSAPDGHLAFGGDCDDASSSVAPGAEELCDGLDNDCDLVVDLDQTVAFESADGTLSDVTSTFGTGSTVTTPTLSEDGTYWFCDGTWYVNLDLAADVELRGRSGDAEAVVLDGGGRGTVVDVRSGAAVVGLHDLTMRSGYGDGVDSLLSGLAGGGLACDSGADITGVGLRIVDNGAYYGGGIGIAGCSLSLSDSEISGNEADSLAGGMALFDGVFQLDGVEIASNSAAGDIGGVYLGRGYSTTSGTFHDVVFSDNSDYYAVGGLYIYDSDLEMTSSSSGSSAFLGNTSIRGYGAIWAYPSDAGVSFTEVDFGDTGGRDDNTIPEILHGYYGHEYVVDGVSTFTCDQERCGSSTSYAVGSVSNSVTIGGRLYGNMFYADSYALIDDFSGYVSISAGCTVDMYILSTTSTPGSSGTWTVEWSDTGVSVGSGGWISGDDVSVLAEPGSWYAFGMAQSCSGGDYVYYTSGSTGTSVGFGSHQGYVYTSSGSYSSSFGSTATLYAATGGIQFAQYIGSTAL